MRESGGRTSKVWTSVSEPQGSDPYFQNPSVQFPSTVNVNSQIAFANSSLVNLSSWSGPPRRWDEFWPTYTRLDAILDFCILQAGNQYFNSISIMIYLAKYIFNKHTLSSVLISTTLNADRRQTLFMRGNDILK